MDKEKDGKGSEKEGVLLNEQENPAETCQGVSMWVLMNKPAAASQTSEGAGADRAELLGQACQSC